MYQILQRSQRENTYSTFPSMADFTTPFPTMGHFHEIPPNKLTTQVPHNFCHNMFCCDPVNSN